MTEHTTSLHADGHTIRNASGTIVGQTFWPDFSDGSRNTALADATLWTAAPDLLDALEAIMSDSDVTEVMNVTHWEAADAAIAKAHGTEDSTNA